MMQSDGCCAHNFKSLLLDMENDRLIIVFQKSDNVLTGSIETINRFLEEYCG